MPTRIPPLVQVGPSRFEHEFSKTWLEVTGSICRPLNVPINGQTSKLVRETSIVLYATIPTNLGRFVHAHKISVKAQLITGQLPAGIEEFANVDNLAPTGDPSIITDVDLKDTIGDMIDYADQSAMIPYLICAL